jgi:hypothetical protein
MNIHKNARLTPHGREEVVRRVREGGESARQVARDIENDGKDDSQVGGARRDGRTADGRILVPARAAAGERATPAVVPAAL